MNPASYSVHERLRDGREVEIRALRPADRAALSDTVRHMSPQALYRRFFAPKRSFTEKEIEFYLNVDFVSHVALVAVMEQSAGATIVGGGRYVVSAPGRAELAFAVNDSHQGLGMATRLMRHLVLIARAAGITQLAAEVLAENSAMQKVFERCGLRATTRREAGVMHVTLDLSREETTP